MKNKSAHIQNSIFLLGPCGVGKSLLSKQLSNKIGLPYIDLDDILFFTELDLNRALSIHPERQKQFINAQLEPNFERRRPLTKEERKREEQLVHEFVDIYNYYFHLLGGYKQFYGIYVDYVTSLEKNMSMQARVKSSNQTAFSMLTQIFKNNDTSFIISVPGSFGWNSKIPSKLQSQIHKLIGQAKSVLLVPGIDYSKRNPTDEHSVNSKFLAKHTENYLNNADLEISTNALFFDPENPFLQQRTWLNVRETMTKEKLLNKGEISNICDQIVDGLSQLERQ